MEFGFQDTPSMSQSIPANEHENSGDVIDEIGRKVEGLIGKINNSRSSDQTVMDGFQQELMNKMTHVCEEMKGSMYTVYEDNSDEMQMKLQELSKVLDNCTRLHQELLEATQALSGLRASLGIKKQE
uniref:Synaptonemal complex central element protein 2 n=1 Tax=Takifugu rubripes TaxID=31033 RepID=A0A3B5KF08_TAKRU